MATIENAVSEGAIELFVMPDWEVRLPIWTLFVTPELLNWVDGTPELEAVIGGRMLIEHLEQTFCDFRCSKRPPAGDLRRMMPNKHGIWKMHPVGTRVYGWFSQPGTFIAVAAALEADTKTDKSLNSTKMNYVRKFIDKFDLRSTIRRGDINVIFPS